MLITCPCGKQKINYNEKICSFCGELLVNFSATRKFDGDNTMEIPIVNDAAILTLSIVDSDERFYVNFEETESITIGRFDPQTNEYPTIDFDSFQGVEHGISRRHAVIAMKNDTFYLCDLGTSNGTFLNEKRLQAKDWYQIVDGDQIMFGRLRTVLSLGG